MPTLVSLRLPETILRPLDKLAKNTERPRTYLIKRALENFLEEYEDYEIAMRRLHDKNDEIISSLKMRKRLGL